LIARDWKWIDTEEEEWMNGLVAQVRHRQKPVGCTIEKLEGDTVKVVFDTEKGVYGVTPGQAVAVWQKERCLGGGIIEKAIEISGGTI
jgi:tRNA-specific 2-thiouridylase